MSKPTIAVEASRALKNELGGALINPDTSLSSAALLSSAAGAASFLPVYKPAAQSAGGSQTFAPGLEANGTLTFYLEAAPPAAIAGQVGSARPYIAGTSFTLLLNSSGASLRIPLAAADNGGNNIWRLSATLTGNNLKMAGEALFDQNPNVTIEIVQSLKMAAPLTDQFVKENWSDAGVRQGLLDTFGGIPFDSSSSFYMMAQQADRDYASEYMVLNCTYTDRVAAPPLPGYIQWQVNWGERAHNYYQDNRDRSRVFYLPDKFELARGPANLPSVSLLQFTMPEGQSAVEKTRATFRIYGKPVVQLERLEDAKRALQAKIGSLPQMTCLQDAHDLRMTLTQSLPNAAGTGSSPSAQNSASIDLSQGVRNELSLNFQQFLALWAAIFSTAPENPLFRGWVDVQLLNGRYSDRIDFDGRIPKEQEKVYFEDILDTSREIVYSTDLSVSTFKTVFQAQASNTQVAAVEIAFGPRAVVTLTGDNLKASIKVERSIGDIVLGKQKADEYSYRLRVMRADGITCCRGKTAETSLWLTLKEIGDCKGDCGGPAGTI